MEFNIYNEKNCRVVTREPSVRLTKGGVIMINTSAMKRMELVAGNRIALAQDKQRPKDWYIYRDADGLEIKSKSGTTQSHRIQSSYLCAEILSSVGLQKGKVCTFKLAAAATEVNGKSYWALITTTVKP